MVKVEDLDATSARLDATGWDVGPVETGDHELRFEVRDPSGWVVVCYRGR